MRKTILFLVVIISLLAFSCASSEKMIMPTGCKPEKKKKYEIIEPTVHKHQKKFMIAKPKTQYDHDRRKEFEKTGK